MELIGYLVLTVALQLAILLLWWKLILPFYPSHRKFNLPPTPPSWPILGHLHLVGSLPHQSFAQLAHKYGPLFFLKLGSVPTVVVSNDVFAREFLRTHDQIFASRPKCLAGGIFSYHYQDVACAEYGPQWRERKKLCRLELFGPQRMEDSKHIRMEEAYYMVKSIGVECETREAVDVRSRLHILTQSIMSRMLFKKNYFLSDSQDAVDLKEIAAEALMLSGGFYLEDFIPYMGCFYMGYKQRMKTVQKKVDFLLDRVIKERRSQNKLDISLTQDSLDFLDLLLSISDKGGYGDIGIDTVKALIGDMMAGGIGTSAVTIEWALSEIIANPLIQQKVQQELDLVVGRERMVVEADLPHLKYLQCIVKETFRLHPPVPIIAHESTQAVEVAGYHIPAKTRLLVNVWALGRDPVKWENALEFSPQRFTSSQIDVLGRNMELIPFGSGRRQCPGLSLGLRTVQLALAVLLQSFEWFFPSWEKLDMSEEFGLTVPRKVSLYAFATPRLPPNLYA